MRSNTGIGQRETGQGGPTGFQEDSPPLLLVRTAWGTSGGGRFADRLESRSMCTRYGQETRARASKALLGIHGRRILDALLVEHNAHAGRENGRLIVTYDQLERGWGVSRRKIAPAIRDLERRGLVRRTAVGCGNRKTGERQPSQYRITFLNSFPDRLRETDEWRAFTAPGRRKKTGSPVSQHDESGGQEVASTRRSNGGPREG
jgi:hypothetical protein